MINNRKQEYAMQNKVQTGFKLASKLAAILFLFGAFITGTSFAGGAPSDGKLKFKKHNHCHKHKHEHGYGKTKKTHRHRHCHVHWHPFKNTGHAHKGHKSKNHGKNIIKKNHHKGGKKMMKKKRKSKKKSK